jgi:hypothetical protein
MALSDERMRILSLIENGQVTAEEGAKLLAALRSSTKEDSDLGQAEARWFRVRVTDLETGRSKVNINIPMALVNVAVKMGARFVPDSEDIDLEALAEAIRSGQQGKILEVTDQDEAEYVEIFVE